eukprot:TRINITY_DN1053_c0_g4_i2.p1 TRINITY_DN1053_c0_g4~~TRINITY_DN1053_c0_g4_i2.p1  ORF type:complete len:300 (-),score=59.82 TRINITY_DN1053_c0_g4_i2:94-954(-)
MKAIVPVLLFFILVAIARSDTIDYFSTTQKGDGTYYGSDSGGQCSLGNKEDIPAAANSAVTVAINNAQFGTSETCGMCVQVHGTGNGAGANPVSTTPFIAFVNNRCPECPSADLDIGTSGDGRWDIEWVAVECDTGDQGISLKLQGSHEWYIKLQIRNHKIPVSSVILVQNEEENVLSRTSDNFFTSDGSVSFPLKFPLPVKIVAINNEVIQTEFSTLSEYQDANSLEIGIPKSVQFNGFKSVAPQENNTVSPTGNFTQQSSNTNRNVNIISVLAMSLFIVISLLI